MNRPRIKTRRVRWSTLAGVGLLALTLAVGCSDEEKPPIEIPFIPVGPSEFGDPQALDLPPASASSVTFDPARHAAMSDGGDGMAVYLIDDGTGTVRMHVVRYDHTRNPFDRSFTAPEVFDANSGDVIDAKVLLDEAGNGLLVWIQVFAGLPRLFASVYSAESGSFTPPQLIDAGGENGTPEGAAGFDAALDAAGNGLIGFFENPGAPGLSEAFGVFFNRTTSAWPTQSFTAPEKVDPFSVSGHTITGVKVLGGPEGRGYVLTLQDADPGPGTTVQCSASRFSTASSLSSFNAVTRVNPPGYDDTVFEVTGFVLPDGDGVFLYRQNDPVSGHARVWGRVFDISSDVFHTGFPDDLAPESASAGLDFQNVIVAGRPDGRAVALFSTGSSVRANVFDPVTRRFDTNASIPVSTGTGTVGSALFFAFGPTGAGEAVFSQGPAGGSQPVRVFACPFDGVVSFGTPRPVDVGSAETGALSTLPMAFADPIPVGAGFDKDGRFLAAFAVTDGHLNRLYVNRRSATDPDRFEGARPVDGCTKSSLFSVSPAYSEVSGGDACLVLSPSGGEGLALWRHREVLGAVTSVRLFGNPYHGRNRAPTPGLTGAVLVDEHPDSAFDRSVLAFDGVGTSTGAVLALVQDSGPTDELYIRSYRGGAEQFDLPGLSTEDNGTGDSIDDVRVLAAAGDDAFVFFLQGDGAGAVQLYGRHVQAAPAAIQPLRTGSPLGNTGASFGSVTDFIATGAGGSAFLAFRQLDGIDHAVFALRVDADGAVTGPARLSTASATNVGRPGVWVSSTGKVLVLFTEGPDLMGRAVPASVYGQGFASGPDSLESTPAPVGAFSADADGQGNFLVAFETGTSGTSGIDILFRRHLAATGSWDAGALAASPQGTANLDHVAPRVQAAQGGRAVLLYERVVSGAAPDRSLMAVTFDPAASTPLSHEQAVDTDGTSANGLDVSGASLAMDPVSGRGFMVFLQDVEVGAPVRTRLFARGFDLSKIGTASAVFFPTPADMSVGGASSATEIPMFRLRASGDGAGTLVHTESLPAGVNDTLTHLFARRFDANTFTFGPARVASRAMNTGSAALEGEGVDAAAVLHTGDGRAVILHTVSQTDSGGPVTYRRLFANVYR